MQIQDAYINRHPHHIPLLFMMDVIHGYRTIFPAPIAQGASFDPEISKRAASVAARETSAAGIHVVFSPMVDLVRDPRWGRVMESTGEDPYLNSRFAAAQIHGFQGDDMKEDGKVCGCIKHFAGYGGAEAGREYNTVQVSEHTFREYYLPSYEAGIKAGAGMVMTSFNTVNDIPATINQKLMRQMLREEMGFDGVLISDYAAILETVAHGASSDKKDAAHKALLAGVDIDMMTGCYAGELAKLVKEGTIPESLIDESVLRILQLKNQLGLFEHPHKDADPEKEARYILCPEHRALAREAAAASCVLLKNDKVLPIRPSQKVAFIGPYTSTITRFAAAGPSPDIQRTPSRSDRPLRNCSRTLTSPFATARRFFRVTTSLPALQSQIAPKNFMPTCLRIRKRHWQMQSRPLRLLMSSFCVLESITSRPAKRPHALSFPFRRIRWSCFAQ